MGVSHDDGLAAGAGTRSTPDRAAQGWQRSSRRAVSQLPRTAPWASRASSA